MESFSQTVPGYSPHNGDVSTIFPFTTKPSLRAKTFQGMLCEIIQWNFRAGCSRGSWAAAVPAGDGEEQPTQLAEHSWKSLNQTVLQQGGWALTCCCEVLGDRNPFWLLPKQSGDPWSWCSTSHALSFGKPARQPIIGWIKWWNVGHGWRRRAAAGGLEWSQCFICC